MNTVSVKFKSTFKVHQFCTSLDFKVGEKVVVDTDSGLELGTIQEAKRGGKKEEEVAIRRLTEADEEKLAQLKEEEKEALAFCAQKVAELRLPMKLIDAIYSLDKKKLTFYFVAEDRVDFRELLRELVAHFHKSIRLQQLGPRDASKLLGGLGPCGRPLCCVTFLDDVGSITLEMAKEQDLVGVGSNKISGACGKLMCCLAYEIKMYEKMRKELPKIGQEIETEKGKGKVVAQNVLRQAVLVELEDGTKIEIRNPKFETNHKF